MDIKLFLGIAIGLMIGLFAFLITSKTRPTEIIQNHTNFYNQKADIWLLSGGRWILDTETKAIELVLEDMP